MILRGKLTLKHDNDDYLMFYKGRNENLTEILNVQLLEDVAIEIKNTYNGKVLFSATGKLLKNKTQPKYYTYEVNGMDLDSVLWDCVDKNISIELVNSTKM